jgi:phosphonate transport system permease protein
MIPGAAGISADRIEAARARLPLAFERPLFQRIAIWSGWAGFALLTGFCLWKFEFSPERIWSGLGHLGDIVVHLFPPMPGDQPREILWALLETVAMAFLGTFLAATLSVPLAFLAAKNSFPFRLPRFAVRRFLDCLRGVDQLIWALIFVRAVGLGPLAGIMAILISDTGTLSKLFSESIENIERKPAEGIKAAGANKIQTLRFGILPQVTPMFLSSALYMFESNVRSATILGIVGAGGIGFQLSDRIRAHHWEEASFILILILVMVACIDWLSKRLRLAVIGQSPAALR